ncbi:putative pentatricopeptide repeat-containing protein At1g64310 [Chenopodium quinoa]|nr:putative pentatricopeptide repeat-containing protein At1g64310 [Chenopodium quinoa]XP_021733557.1 putative pentatricopeptide repeat-containing protein At1g64310 [Chenopodium quinoa]XP_021733559.1 putative pentatricopeptide repeat-containing protein At1g64310 [Chenopodium quinoa]
MITPLRIILSKFSIPHQTISNTKQLHGMIAKTHLSLDPFFATKIIRYYALNGDLTSAHQLFAESPQRSIYLWNSIIRAYAQVHDFKNAFHLFNQLLRSELCPDNFTFACILRACYENNDVEGVRLVHGGLVVSGLQMNSICGSSLVNAYSKLGFVDDASKVFNGVIDPDLATWNSLIQGYGYCGIWDEGLKLFNAMRNMGIQPDGYAVVGLLSALNEHRLLQIGQGIHGLCVKSGFLLNDHVGSSLVTMYSRCECLDSAQGVLYSLSKPDIVTWSALITGLANSGDIYRAFLLFRERNVEGMKADPVLLASVLAASVRLGHVGPGCEVHGYVLRHGLEIDIRVASALIDMYSKCGFVDLAIQVLNVLHRQNIIIYNAAILGLGSHGNAEQAFRLFDEAIEKGLIPDESTFSALLHACCQSGLVREGEEFFSRMKDEFGIKPRNEHYVHMVKILGMAGKLKEAHEFVLCLSEPVDAGVWGALLACCEMHGNFALAEVILQHVSENQMHEGSHSILLSRIYANHERWDDVEKLREDTRDSGQKKLPGFSWIGGKIS